MFKSVFTKYMSAFMAIILISFLILGFIMSSKITDYSIEAKTESMQRTAEGTVQSILTLMKISGNNFDYLINNYKSDLEAIVEKQGEYSESVIFITDTQGHIMLSSDNEKDILLQDVPIKTVNNILAGSFDYKLSTLDGVFKSKHLNYIYTINENVLYESNGEKISGLIFISASSNQLMGFVDDMSETLILSILVIFIVALIAIYLISEKMIRPLKQMSEAAKAFAQGKFDVRVPVTGQDEVGRLALAFNNMASSLAAFEDMRRTFLGNISHDLRTPMTTIAGFIDGILDGAIPPEKHSYYLGIIASEVRRLSRLVNSLLDISRIQAGDRKFNKTAFDVCETARQILISFEKRIDEKHLDVEFNCEKEKMMVYADKDAIHQVLYNLCDNAVKFSYDKGYLKITLVEKDKKAFISVKNSGSGIIPEDLPFVFDRFYKSDRSRGLDKSGVGLGLYIVKAIIDQHEEEIWVKSAYQEYCEFVFTLQSTKEPGIIEPKQPRNNNDKS